MKSIKVLVLSILFLLASSFHVLAVPLAPGYELIDAPFWSFTDYTTANSQFTLVFKDAYYNSSFGLYTVDSAADPTKIEQTFEIFSYTDVPKLDPIFGHLNTKTVTLRNLTGDWEITHDLNNWTPFSNVFGFYFGVHQNPNSPVVTQTYYSYTPFNTDGLVHILTAFNKSNQAYVYLDDQFGGGDRDFNDRIVHANDIAPVPEPGTLLLLGAGIAGLALYRRRSMIK